jgi:UDP-3-O-acyl N-acetylglucosamine deacetylase
MKLQRKTIKQAVEFAGCGLHTGVEINVQVLPAAAETGVVFARSDLADKPQVAASLANVISSNRGTDLKRGEAEVKTVEHFLAVVSHLGITDLMIEVDGVEMPAMGGSAAQFLDKMRQAGQEDLEGFVQAITLEREIKVGENGCQMSARPAAQPSFSYHLVYDHPALGEQQFSFSPEQMSFDKELSPARTFCLEEEIEQLKAAGLAQGGSLDNALVIGEKGYVNEVVHFPDEPCRHKVLDMIGDLFLLGQPLLAEVSGERSGHTMNAELAKAILAQSQEKEG